MFLFDFDQLIEELKNNENKDKKDVIEQYEKHFGPIGGQTIQDQVWYKEYVSKFQTVEYTVPFSSKDDFDYGLLCQLAAASFSSEVALDINEE